MSLSRSSWLTVSKALVRSIATTTVLSTGLRRLRPVVMWEVSSWRAVAVECFFRKPCWWDENGMELEISGRRIASRIFAGGERSEIGR